MRMITGRPRALVGALFAGSLVLSACGPTSAPAPQASAPAAPATQPPAPGQPAAKTAGSPAPKAAASPASSTGSGAKMTVKFSHVVAEGTPKGKGAVRFAELVKQKSGGNIDVQVYANSSLYKDAEEMDAIQKGQVEILAPSTAKFSVTNPEWQVFDLPYIFGSPAGVKRVADGPVGKELYAKLNSSGMQGLALWDNGFKDLTNGRKALKRPEDFRGIKFRVQGKVDESFMKALGAGAQVMAFSEVFGALQQGVVDGQFNTWSNIFTQKFHEVQKYASITGTSSYLAYAVVANKAWWDKLAPADRQIIESSMLEATDYVRELAKQENDDAREKVKATGRLETYTWTKEDETAFREALKPVYTEFEGKIGKDLISRVQKEGA